MPIHKKEPPQQPQGLPPPEVEQAIKTVRGFLSTMRHFIHKMAGWRVEELPNRDLSFPLADTRSRVSHKITFTNSSITSTKVAHLLQSVQKQSEIDQAKPKKHEIDAFRLKALLLLQQESRLLLSLKESIHYVHDSPLEPSLGETHHLQLRQIISHFPGEEIEIKGLFRRESALSETSIPLRKSFQLSMRFYQSGFPHPIQYTGFTWSEKLLPESLMHPQSLPEIDTVLRLKTELAHALHPSGHYNKKAKAYLQYRRQLFQTTDTLFLLHKKQIESTFKSVEKKVIDDYFESLLAHPFRLDELGKTHEQIGLVSTHAIAHVQREWLLQQNSEISQENPQLACATCKAIMEVEIAKACAQFLPDHPLGRYQRAIGLVLGKATLQIALLQLSEHLGFMPPEIESFEHNILTSLLRQQLVFANELQHVPEGLSYDLFEGYLIEQIEEEIAIFDGLFSADAQTIAAKELASKLIVYYT